MAGNNTNVAVMRDERGRYLKGMPGGPGRPVGSRNKLTEDFLGDLHAAWLQHGVTVIERVIRDRPEAFLAIVARLIKIDRIELGQPGAFDQAQTREQVLQKVEERYGLAGRKMFEQFVANLHALENGGQKPCQ